MNFINIKKPHAHQQYASNMYIKFEKNPLKTWKDLITQTLYLLCKAAQNN